MVTLSFSPHIVVHVNTAYTRLTGFSSAKVLGKPLQVILSAGCCEVMKGCNSQHPIAALDDRVSTIRTKEKYKQNSSCRLQANLVGPPLEGKKEPDTSLVTHYSVTFLPLIPSSSKHLQQMPPTNSSVCKKAEVSESATSSEERISTGDTKIVIG